MTLPLLNYPPSAQNQRVYGFEVSGEEQPRQYYRDVDAMIMAAYRQIFNEQQLTSSTRQPALESQLRCGQISVRDFVRQLATSDVFRTRNYDTNNNYRFVQMCVQRILGREVYNDREKFAWSIVLATQGLHGFIDALLSTEEYLTNFGDDVVPYQRRRILPQQSSGELPFARMARYGTDYRDRLPQPLDGQFDDKFAAFDLNRFMQQANWPVAIGLVLSLSVLVAFLLLLSLTLGTPQG